MKSITELIDEFNEQNHQNLVFYEQEQLVMENRNGVLFKLNFVSHFESNQGWNPKNYGIQANNITENLIELIIEVESILVDQEVEKAGLLIKNNDSFYPAGLGVCHTVWALKREKLRSKYGIIWKSPAELNRSIMYD